MKRIGLLGSMLGAGMLQLLAHGGGWKDVGRAVAPRRYAYTGRTPTLTFRSSADTSAARHWHNPADPVQAARIEAAAAKREYRAVKLERHTLKTDRNTVHLAQTSDSLLPFYVAK